MLSVYFEEPLNTCKGHNKRCSVQPLSFPFHCIPHHVKHSTVTKRSSLDELLEGAVDGRADFGALVEIDCGYGTLADAFGGKFEFLNTMVSILGF